MIWDVCDGENGRVALREACLIVVRPVFTRLVNQGGERASAECGEQPSAYCTVDRRDHEVIFLWREAENCLHLRMCLSECVETLRDSLTHPQTSVEEDGAEEDVAELIVGRFASEEHALKGLVPISIERSRAVNRAEVDELLVDLVANVCGKWQKLGYMVPDDDSGLC